MGKVKHSGTTGVCIFRPPGWLIDCVGSYLVWSVCLRKNILAPLPWKWKCPPHPGGGNSFIFKTGSDAKEPLCYLSHTWRPPVSQSLCCVITVHCWIKHTPWKKSRSFASHTESMVMMSIYISSSLLVLLHNHTSVTMVGSTHCFERAV